MFDTPHAQVALVAERTALPTEGSLSVGLRFVIDQGWHIYWRNPGDSGGPPVVEWTLPAGIEAGDLEWPAPTRLSVSGLVNYGYEDRVLLISTLRGRVQVADAGGPILLRAHVKYVICQDVCIAAAADVQLQLAIGAGVPAPAATMFRDARLLLPRAWPRAWTASAECKADDIAITIDGPGPNRRVEFFPVHPGELAGDPLRIVRRPDGFTLELKRSPYLRAWPARLDGVVAIGGVGAFTLELALRAKSCAPPPRHDPTRRHPFTQQGGSHALNRSARTLDPLVVARRPGEGAEHATRGRAGAGVLAD